MTIAADEFLLFFSDTSYKHSFFHPFIQISENVLLQIGIIKPKPLEYIFTYNRNIGENYSNPHGSTRHINISQHCYYSSSQNSTWLGGN